jgi:hypothetical protein
MFNGKTLLNCTLMGHQICFQQKPNVIADPIDLNKKDTSLAIGCLFII